MTRRNIIHQPISLVLWFILAFQGGAVNISGFMAIHKFVSHVTGFSALFANELVSKNYINSLYALLVPFFFLLGSFFTGLFSTSTKVGKLPRFFVVFITLSLIFFFIAIYGQLGYFGVFAEDFIHIRDVVLLILLSFSMGSQNAIITHYSNSIVRTTHLTGITTDLGIGLAEIVNGVANDLVKRTNYIRIGIIVFFVIGSVFANILFSKVGFLGFYFFGLLNLSIAVIYLIIKIRRGNGHSKS